MLGLNDTVLAYEYANETTLISECNTPTYVSLPMYTRDITPFCWGYCGHCGTQLYPADCFCGQCGNIVDVSDYQN